MKRPGWYQEGSMRVRSTALCYPSSSVLRMDFEHRFALNITPGHYVTYVSIRIPDLWDSWVLEHRAADRIVPGWNPITCVQLHVYYVLYYVFRWNTGNQRYIPSLVGISFHLCLCLFVVVASVCLSRTTPTLVLLRLSTTYRANYFVVRRQVQQAC
jgi:hypothetical protein